MINEEIFLNSAKSCAFTGHRTLYPDFDREKVSEVIDSLINNGFDTFLVGMAVGFDTECFKILLKKREEKYIKIVACIPCENQSERFNFNQKKEYSELIEKADVKVILQKEYSSVCMRKRNEFMVGNSSVLVAYLRRDYGGTSQTVKIAERQGKKIIYV